MSDTGAYSHLSMSEQTTTGVDALRYSIPDVESISRRKFFEGLGTGIVGTLSTLAVYHHKKIFGYFNERKPDWVRERDGYRAEFYGFRGWPEANVLKYRHSES